MVEGSPPGDTLPPPPQRATPARKGARCGTSAGSPRPHRPHPGHTGRGTLAARSRGRAAGGGTAPDTRRSSQWWKAAPRGRPSATPLGSNAGPQGRTLWNNRCWVPTPAPTAPETHGSWYHSCPLRRTGGRGRDSARHQAPLTTVAGHPPRGRPPAIPAARSPHRVCRPRGKRWAPTPTHPRPQHMGSGPQQPAQWAGSRGRDSA